jgi:hypothetical protein
MSSSDRLTELRRQRALVQEHLAWLDREIGDAEKTLAAPSSAAKASAPTLAVETRALPAVPATKSTTTAWTGRAAASDAAVGAPQAEADAIIEKYRVPSTDIQNDIRKGCFLYFAAAFLILGGVIAVLYFALRH